MIKINYIKFNKDKFVGLLAQQSEKESKKALELRGHRLTGRGAQSLRVVNALGRVEGYGNNYLGIVNTGFKREKASMKQFPFVLNYVKKRQMSSDPTEQKAIAAAIIRKWMKEKGMSTIASRRFSKDGKRNNWVKLMFNNLKPIQDNFITLK